MKKFSLRENITELLAILATFGCFILLILLCFKVIPTENKDLLNILGGVIIGATLGPVYSYYYGTSKNRNIPTEPGQSITTVQKSTISEEVKP